MKSALQIPVNPISLKLLKESGYIDAVIKDSKISSFTVLPLGKIFLQQIKNEWTKSFLEPLRTVKPSELTTTNDVNNKVIEIESYFNQPEVKETFKFSKEATKSTNLIQQCKGFLVKTLILPKISKQTQENFQRLQRERKIWWMKHSSNPCSLEISEIQRKNETQIVSITEKSELLGPVDIETITISPLNDQIVLQNYLHEENSCFSLLENALDSGTLDIHRKLAPFQVCIFHDFSLKPANRDLKDLSKLLTIKMKKADIRALNSEYFEGKCDLYELADKIGIPYGIEFCNETLQNGIIKLRNRKTKIFETIHVTDIPNYLIKIFK